LTLRFIEGDGNVAYVSQEDDVSGQGSRAAIQAAAFRLFDELGYDATSVEDIATAAGVSRSTFFRLFGSKEAVIFPDHDALLATVSARLYASSAQSAIAAVSDAVRLVLFHYVAEGDRARKRYRLTSKVEALRERELVSGARYHRLFREYILETGGGTSEGEMRAELMAAAVVAAHNRVLRRWLRGQCSDPQVEIDQALATVRGIFEESPQPAPAIIVVGPDVQLDALADSIRRVATEQQHA
jgi:AcrR family transcriptional regulator